MNIKGIFFDFDGVITMEKEGSPTMISYISKKTGIPSKQIEDAYYKRNKKLLYGELTHKKMWEDFCKEIGSDIDYRLLEESFLNVTLDQQIINYINENKEKYLIGMITDNKADRIDSIINNTALKGLFDVVIISANVHSRKSEEKIFREALEQSGLEAQECVFIDNTRSNLEVPNKMGFTTIFFNDENRDYSQLYKIIE